MRAMIIMMSIIGLLWQADLSYAIPKSTNTGDLDTSSKWKRLDHYAEQIYQASVHGELENIQQTVMEMEKLFTETPFNNATSVEGVRALSNAIIQVKRVVSSVKLKQEELMSATVKLRLVTDAITHAKQAMWLQYEQVLRDDLAHMLATDKQEEWIPFAQRWIQHVDRILPAATIQRDVRVIQMMESLRQLVVESISGRHTLKDVNAVLNKYSDTGMVQLFGSSKASPTLGPPAYYPMSLQWTFMLACIVCVLLAYVAYQRYHYEQYAIRPGSFRKIKK